jgi:hypothetical protein
MTLSWNFNKISGIGYMVNCIYGVTQSRIFMKFFNEVFYTDLKEIYETVCGIYVTVHLWLYVKWTLLQINIDIN